MEENEMKADAVISAIIGWGSLAALAFYLIKAIIFAIKFLFNIGNHGNKKQLR
jgi:hypothetical protein